MYPPKFLNYCNQVLKQGCHRFGLTLGIVSHIRFDLYEVAAVYSKSNRVAVGASFELKQTYCREVFNTGRVLALTEIGGVTGLQKHPLYETFPLEVYISAPIFYRQHIWGTLNFSSTEVRTTPFTISDINYIEEAARQVSNKVLGFDLEPPTPLSV